MTIVARDLVTPSEFTPGSLIEALRNAGFDVELVESDLPMRSVPAAAAAIGVLEAEIIKTLLFQDKDGQFVRAIAAGPDRVDRKRLADLAGTQTLSMASAEAVLSVTGWPPGGVAPVGSRKPVRTFVDERVVACVVVYGGGGTEYALLRMAPSDIVTITSATVANLTASSIGDPE